MLQFPEISLKLSYYYNCNTTNMPYKEKAIESMKIEKSKF